MRQKPDLHQQGKAECERHGAQRECLQGIRPGPGAGGSDAGRTACGDPIGHQAKVMGMAAHDEQADRPHDRKHQQRHKAHRRAESEFSDQQEQRRHADHAAQACPEQRSRYSPALVSVKPGRQRGGDRRSRQAGPAQAHAGERRVYLPDLADLPDAGKRNRQKRGADRHDRPGAESRDQAADHAKREAVDDKRASQRRRNQPDRPAARLTDRIEIDAGAIKRTGPGHYGDHQAAGHHPPAVKDAPDHAEPWSIRGAARGRSPRIRRMRLGFWLAGHERGQGFAASRKAGEAGERHLVGDLRHRAGQEPPSDGDRDVRKR